MRGRGARACQSWCASPGGGEITEERRDAARRSAGAEIYREQFLQPKLTLGGTRCMKNDSRQGAADSSARRTNQIKAPIRGSGLSELNCFFSQKDQ